MLGFPGFHQGHEHVKAVAIRRVALGVHETFDLLEGAAVVALRFNGPDIHISPRLGRPREKLPHRSFLANIWSPLQ